MLHLMRSICADICCSWFWTMGIILPRVDIACLYDAYR